MGKTFRQKYVFNILQVDSLVDVGAAAYAQLQKTKGQSIDEINTKKNVRCIQKYMGL